MTAVAAVLALPLGACGDDGGDSGDGGDGAAPGTTAAAEGEVLRIHVTNDDGVGAAGLDTLVRALDGMERVELHVVAPLENQSGSSDTTTGGDLTAEDATTAGGHEAQAVPGYPADSVLWAHEEHFAGDVEPPHLTISGINAGQNIGPLAYVSGTVGAARQSVREGVPALAVSQGLGDPVDYEAAAPHTVEWVEEHRAALVNGSAGTDEGAREVAWSLNVPTCPEGEVRGLVETTLAPTVEEGSPNPLDPVDCTSTADPEGLQDIEAFQIGYATLTEVPVEAPES